MKEGDFIHTYLRLDEDGDYVVKSTPCPFLGSTISAAFRGSSSDCARYPYTNEDVFSKENSLL